jgi:hypothetical protein
MVNWTEILEESNIAVDALTDFVDHELTGREVIQVVNSPELRRVIRDRGVDQTRILARKALRRRQLV